MTENEKFKIIDNNYFDLIIKYGRNESILDQYSMYSPHMISEYLATIYLPIDQVTPNIITEFGYAAVPNCYSLSSEESLTASGVNRLRQIPAINLSGSGVIVGIIDTGIDYTNPIFIRSDGTSKVIAIWDQSIDSENLYPYAATFPTFYGTEYSADQINLALRSENPLEIVPSIDEIGHGTKMAGIAAGAENIQYNFSGVAPDADLLIVKLKQAKKNLTDFYFIPEGVPCYQENDLIWAIKYMVYKARGLRRPLALCIGAGTSQGPHDNSGYLNIVASIHADTAGVAMSFAAGNEGNARRHFYSTLQPETDPITVGLNVGENEAGFSMEIWGEPPTIYSLDITSPSGEYIPSISGLLDENRVISFLYEQTIIYIDYVMIEQESGKQLILLRFQNPSSGVWNFNIYGRGDLKGAFHIWLPSNGFITNETYFLISDQYTTITSPANSIVPISITAYNSRTNSIYIDSGRGFSTSNIINPSLAAPGVNIQCPTLDHGFTSMTGSSAAVAHATGITAMLLEWCIVNNNYPNIDSVGIKKFLIGGANRNSNLVYPNREWGYGTIDVYNAFQILRTNI